MALLTSLAVVDTPKLLRLVRRHVGIGDPGAEIDLWNSNLVAYSNTGGFGYRRKVAEELRLRLTEHHRLELARIASELTAQAHDKVVPPAVQVEEEWRGLAVSPVTLLDAVQRVDGIAALVGASTPGTRAWARGLYDRLPPTLAKTEGNRGRV